MRFIEPSVEYWKQDEGLAGVWKQIARATRTCYQSTPKNNGESDEDFVKRVILKPALINDELDDLDDLECCEFDFNKMHGGMLEFGTIYLKSYFYDDIPDMVEFYNSNPYSRCCIDNLGGIAYITTNMRVIIENERYRDLQLMCEPTMQHKRRYTFSCNTDIGVSREFNRHRASMSIAEQSTRYCCYNRDKFGGEISYARPAWFKKDNHTIVETNNLTKEQQQGVFKDWCEAIARGEISNWDADSYYRFGLMASEFTYMGMRSNKEIADHCRQVLNLNTKTQVVYCAFEDDWKHFIKLRADNYSGKAHPNINLIANNIKQLIKENNL